MKKNTAILMYHSIGGYGTGEIGAELYCVSVAKFKAQLEYLKEIFSTSEYPANKPSYAENSPSFIISEKNKRKDTYELPSIIEASNIVITFDDGLLDNYLNAFPILKEMGFRGYFFIHVAKTGTQGYMNWEQIKEMENSGMIIGSHGMTHRILTQLTNADLTYELKESKKILEKKLGHSVDYLSIPRGFYNSKVMEEAKRAGYKSVFTSIPNDNDGFKFGRIPVKGSWDLPYFVRVLEKGYSLKDKTIRYSKNAIIRIFGLNLYDNIRSALLKFIS